ncbi:MAG: prepilin-type cleavage/methylation domain-containing protein [Gammaproteobacteria bacterium]|nr:prepilin-type cleavage/methylation domain-containing protein [Gammaproteobacteria bacterium]
MSKINIANMASIKSTKTQGGFTLIEIAIVLVIIGLLLGGVLQGQQLIENSRIRNATNSFNGIAAGAFSYQDRYGRMPGDDNAGAGDIIDRGDAWASVVEGNGNGFIDAALADTFSGDNEAGDFFQHMRAAGFLAGDADLTGLDALPQNPFGGLIGITTAAMGGGLNGTKICMNNVNGSAAIALDAQLDDGTPNGGRFRSVEGTNAAPTDDGDTDPYSEDSTYTVCYRI